MINRNKLDHNILNLTSRSIFKEDKDKHMAGLFQSNNESYFRLKHNSSPSIALLEKRQLLLISKDKNIDSISKTNQIPDNDQTHINQSKEVQNQKSKISLERDLNLPSSFSFSNNIFFTKDNCQNNSVIREDQAENNMFEKDNKEQIQIRNAIKKIENDYFMELERKLDKINEFKKEIEKLKEGKYSSVLFKQNEEEELKDIKKNEGEFSQHIHQIKDFKLDLSSQEFQVKKIKELNSSNKNQNNSNTSLIFPVSNYKKESKLQFQKDIETQIQKSHNEKMKSLLFQKDQDKIIVQHQVEQNKMALAKENQYKNTIKSMLSKHAELDKEIRNLNNVIIIIRK